MTSERRTLAYKYYELIDNIVIELMYIRHTYGYNNETVILNLPKLVVDMIREIYQFTIKQEDENGITIEMLNGVKLSITYLTK